MKGVAFKTGFGMQLEREGEGGCAGGKEVRMFRPCWGNS